MEPVGVFRGDMFPAVFTDLVSVIKIAARPEEPSPGMARVCAWHVIIRPNAVVRRTFFRMGCKSLPEGHYELFRLPDSELPRARPFLRDSPEYIKNNYRRERNVSCRIASLQAKRLHRSNSEASTARVGRFIDGALGYIETSTVEHIMAHSEPVK